MGRVNPGSVVSDRELFHKVNPDYILFGRTEITANLKPVGRCMVRIFI